MKLQIAFDMADLDQALAIASEVEKHTDMFKIGSLLLNTHGISAIKRFKEAFSQKTLIVDAKIVEHSKEAIALLADAGADWITVMAGAPKAVIHTACTVAHELHKKIILDLLDAHSLGQSALEAKSLGVDAIMFDRGIDPEQKIMFQERWEMVYGNTQLPIFISNQINKENIVDIIALSPAAIVIDKAITHAQSPVEEALYFQNLIHG